MTIRIAGIGTALPDKIVTNDDLAQAMDTSDAWIRERSGITERRVGGHTGELGAQAGSAAIEAAGLSPDDIDLLILSTTSADQMLPGSSAVVQHDIGLSCGAFDLNAACAGFAYGYVAAYGLMQLPGGPERVLLVGAEALSKLTDWTDRGTAILFGDAGAAVVMERHDQGEMLSFDLGADGALRSILYADHGDTIKMEGREVFKRAVRAVSGSAKAALERAGIGANDVDVVIFHQANMRIIEAVCNRTGLDIAKTHNVIEYTGNTSSATIPLCLKKASDDGALHPGRTVLLTGFGAGMTWASVVLRW